MNQNYSYQQDQILSQTNDPQVDQIINKVLKQPIVKSNWSIASRKIQQASQSRYYTSQVNKNLLQQNVQLRNSIKNLQKKIRNIEKSLSNKNKHVNASQMSQSNTGILKFKFLQQENTIIDRLKTKIAKAQQLSNKLSTRIMTESKELHKSRQKMLNSKKFSKLEASNTMQTIIQKHYSKSRLMKNNQVPIITSPIMQYDNFELINQQQQSIDNKISSCKQNQRKQELNLPNKLSMKNQKLKRQQKAKGVKVKERRQKQVQVKIGNQNLEQQAQNLAKKKNQLEAIIKRNQLKLKLYQQKLQNLVL